MKSWYKVEIEFIDIIEFELDLFVSVLTKIINICLWPFEQSSESLNSQQCCVHYELEINFNINALSYV